MTKGTRNILYTELWLEAISSYGPTHLAWRVSPELKEHKSTLRHNVLKSKRKESCVIHQQNVKPDPALFHLLNLRSSLLIVHYHIPALLLHARATALLTNTSDTGTHFHTDTVKQLFQFKQNSHPQKLTGNRQNWSWSSFTVSRSNTRLKLSGTVSVSFLLPDFLNYSVHLHYKVYLTNKSPAQIVTCYYFNIRWMLPASKDTNKRQTTTPVEML